MSTYHAVVWMDHSESHVLMFDQEHIERQLIKSKSHHKHQGKAHDMGTFFKSVSEALESTHEILITGPGSTRVEFQEWCKVHQAASLIPLRAITPVTGKSWPWPRNISSSTIKPIEGLLKLRVMYLRGCALQRPYGFSL